MTNWAMQTTIFKFILRHSKKEQVFLLLLTLISFPFLYLSLDLPKRIVNDAIGSSHADRGLFGLDLEGIIGRDLDQISYLIVLCAAFLLLVLINGVFKYSINVYKGVVGERMLRRLRYLLFEHVLRFPLPKFRKTSQGEIVSMIAAETEPLGGFVGDSIALPAFQGGTLLTILIFMFVQDWKLGLAAIALYPVQMWAIPKLQRRVNLLKKERTLKVRKLSERIGEVVGGIQEVHAHNTANYELADFSERMDQIFSIRYDIYRKKFFIKFLNNFLAQITPFFFFSIGGYLVIKGNLSFGALVAVLAAYKDMSNPWKELLTYYQLQADAKLKYQLLADTFQADGLVTTEALYSKVDRPVNLTGDLVASNVDLAEEDEADGIAGGPLSLKVSLDSSLSVIGDSSSGKDRLAQAIASLRKPRSGTIILNGVNLSELPESVTGRQIAYVGQEVKLRSGTLRDNLYYPLKYHPGKSKKSDDFSLKERERWLREAIASGNSTDDLSTDWIDYAKVGVDDAESLTARTIEVLSMTNLEESVYQLGLQSTINVGLQKGLVSKILEARAELKDRLEVLSSANLVELFDEGHYNTNLSVGENLLFGTPKDTSFDLDNLASNSYVREVLQQQGLWEDFLKIGHEVAELMVDLFADVEQGSELFEQFSFITHEELPDWRQLLSRINKGEYDQLSEIDGNRLVGLTFRLVVARHRLGVIGEAMQERLLKARHAFAAGFEDRTEPVDFFHPSSYNPQLSIQDNILFGRLAYGRARAATEIGALISEVIEKRGLRRAILELGLDHPVGVSGARLSSTQRQKLGIARCLLKRPEIIILDEATAMLDGASQAAIMKNIVEVTDSGLIWVLHRATLGKEFNQTVVMDGGKVVQQGRFDELNQPGTKLSALVADD